VERTYLALDAQAQFRPARAPNVPARLERLHPCPVDSWRALYRQIGAEWHWHDRDAWDFERIQEHLRRVEIQIYRLVAEQIERPDEAAGFLELEHHRDGSVEIVYLGLDRRVFGLGLGGWLLTEAVRHAFALGTDRVWLHTCTLDGPAALPNYLARGFHVERTETYHALLSS
jgi:ribosomal protein S18 acetylase RimI-like enzyme